MTDLTMRTSYVDGRAAAMLYGDDGRSTRKHLEVDVDIEGPLRLTMLEWLSLPRDATGAGLLILHVDQPVDDPRELLDRWAGLVRWKLPHGGEPALLEPLSRTIGHQVSLAEVNDEPYRIGFLDTTPEGTPPFEGLTDAPEAPWLMALAAALRPDGFQPSVRVLKTLDLERLQWSSDWSALVLRDGAAFLGHPHRDPNFVASLAPTYVGSIYTDALLLGVLQRDGLRDFTERLAALEDPARHPRGVERLDAEFSRFRNTVWWQHLTQHGPGNELLLAFQKQHRLPELMEQTRSELDDYSRQASLRASRVLNVVVAVFALVGVLGVGIDAFLLLTTADSVPATSTLLLASLLFIFLLVVVVAYPLGLLSRVLPRRRAPFRPRGWRRTP